MSNLTFGIEIECMLICPMSDCEIVEKEGRCLFVTHAPKKLMYEALSRPFQARCYREDCNEIHTYTLPLRPSEDLRLNSYDTWDVSHDGTIGCERDDPIDPNSHVVGQIELKSRILDFSKPTPCCSSHESEKCSTDPTAWPWLWEVNQILTILQNEFNSPKRPNYRLKVNSTTGLHVHVGGVENHLWSKVARGVTGLFTACERQLETILPDYRIGTVKENRHNLSDFKIGRITQPSTELENQARTQYCRPLSETHFEKVARPQFISQLWSAEPIIYLKNSKDLILSNAMQSLHVPAWLYLIYYAQNTDQLQQWLSNRNASVNLVNLVLEPDTAFDNKQTIEFRSHAGSVDFAEISAWVDLTVSMVNWAQSTNSADAIKQMLQLWGSNEDRLISLAQVIGTQTSTQQHYCAQYPKAQTPGSAIQRFNNLMELDATYDSALDNLGPQSRHMEQKRMDACIKSAVAAKIQTKFLNGYYGKFPQTMLTRYIRRDFGDDPQMQKASSAMAIADNDKVPVISTTLEDPVAGWRRALIALANKREAEIKYPSTGMTSSTSSSSSSSSSSSGPRYCCGLPIRVPLRKASTVFGRFL